MKTSDKCPVEHTASTKKSRRGEIIRTEFGPLLNDVLQPMYRPYLSDKEAELLSPTNDHGMWLPDKFALSIGTVLNNRIEQYPNIVALVDAFLEEKRHTTGSSITFNRGALEVIREGIATGCVTPLRAGLQILLTEQDRPELGRGLTIGDRDDLVEILQRAELDKVWLEDLAIGPPTYLGVYSLAPSKTTESLDRFFKFTDISGGALTPRQVFKANFGRVIGMNEAFREASQRRRQECKNEQTSDGCAVRREQELADSGVQESLILTGKTFLIAALNEIGNERVPIR